MSYVPLEEHTEYGMGRMLGFRQCLMGCEVALERSTAAETSQRNPCLEKFTARTETNLLS